MDLAVGNGSRNTVTAAASRRLETLTVRNIRQHDVRESKESISHSLHRAFAPLCDGAKEVRSSDLRAVVEYRIASGILS
jgi:hypothetical protein